MKWCLQCFSWCSFVIKLFFFTVCVGAKKYLGRNSQGHRLCLRSSSLNNCRKTDLEKISLQMSGQKTHDTEGILSSLAFCLWEGLEFCSIHPGTSKVTYSKTVLLHIGIKRKETQNMFTFFFPSFFSTRLFFTKKTWSKIVTRCTHYDAVLFKIYIVVEADISRLKKTKPFVLHVLL